MNAVFWVVKTANALSIFQIGTATIEPVYVFTLFLVIVGRGLCLLVGFFEHKHSVVGYNYIRVIGIDKYNLTCAIFYRRPLAFIGLNVHVAGIAWFEINIVDGSAFLCKSS